MKQGNLPDMLTSIMNQADQLKVLENNIYQDRKSITMIKLDTVATELSVKNYR